MKRDSDIGTHLTDISDSMWSIERTIRSLMKTASSSASSNPSSSHPLSDLWNIFVTSQILPDSNSTADRIVMLQLQPGAKPTDEFLESIGKLKQLNVRIWWLPSTTAAESTVNSTSEANATVPPPGDNPQGLFDQATMLKFHILRLTSYQRLLYLDSDMILM